MHNLIESLELAVKSENWYAALLIALTLPDVCSFIENPNCNSSKQRYIKWYDENLKVKYTKTITGNERVFLTGSDLYAFRCSCLHQFDSNIDKQRSRITLKGFRIVIDDPPRICIHRNRIGDVLQISIIGFCNDVIDSVKQWSEKKALLIESTKDREGFLRISDVRKETSFSI